MTPSRARKPEDQEHSSPTVFIGRTVRSNGEVRLIDHLNGVVAMAANAVLLTGGCDGEPLLGPEFDQATGAFRVGLPPAVYVLRPEGGNPFPTVDEQTVVVRRDEYTEVVVSLDTGIR